MKKIKEYTMLEDHPQYFKIKHRKDGTEFHVAKSLLDKETHDKIKALAPHMSEGGEVEEAIKQKEVIDKENEEAIKHGVDLKRYPASLEKMMDATEVDAKGQPVRHYEEGGEVDATPALPVAASPEQVAATPPPAALAKQEAPSEIPEAPAQAEQPYLSPADQAKLQATQEAQQPQAERAPSAAPESELQPANQLPVNPAQGYSGSAQDALALQRQGIAQNAIAQSEGQKQAAEAYKQQQKELEAAQLRHQTEKDILDSRQKELFQAASDQKIDPNRYWANMSTGNKILAGIGIALGGISTNANHTNQSLNIINRAIDRDIESQKANMGQKNNLFRMNLDQLNDERAAYAQTKLDAITLAQAKVNQAMATAGSEQAQANGKQLLGQLDQQAAMLKYQLANLNATDVNGPSPQSLRAMIATGIIPKEQQKEAVKELGEYDVMNKALKDTDKVFDIATKNATYSERSLPHWFPTVRDASKKYEAVTEAWLANITKETAGRVTPQDVELMGRSLPKAGDSPEVRKTKLDNIKDIIKEKYKFPTLQTYNLMSSSANRSPATGAAGIQFTPIKK